VDPTKPEHRRFIALWLVDPNYRIISTANVSPQQRHWSLEAILGSSPSKRNASTSKLTPEIISLLGINLSAEDDADYGEVMEQKRAEGKLPAELLEMVWNCFEENQGRLTGLEEAKGHQLKLMEMRSWFAKTSRDHWQQQQYCEH
jgi:hypothetical protein